MIVYLIGFMGCGKSTSGKQLAKFIQFDFVDTDKLFESQEKISINEYFEKYGEEKFRIVEQSILKSIEKDKNIVVATGGGTPCFFDNMEYMRNTGITVYLQLNPSILCKRLIHSHNIRPKVKDKNLDELKEWIDSLIVERTPFYKKAHVIIDARTVTPAMLAKVLNPYFSRPSE